MSGLISPTSICYGLSQSVKIFKHMWGWNLGNLLIEKVVTVMRNHFYLPQLNAKEGSIYDFDEKIAKELLASLTNLTRKTSSDLERVRSHFDIYDFPLNIHSKRGIVTFNLRGFESKSPIKDKSYKVILFSFYGNEEMAPKGVKVPWNPREIDELSLAPLNILEYLHGEGQKTNTLVLNSLGNVVLDGLKFLPKDQNFLPKTIVINRGLTSVKKVARKLYPFPLSYLLYVAAKAAGWNANPEKQLKRFLDREREDVRCPHRNIIIVESQKDHYFSEEGGFHPEYHTKIQKRGASVFRASYYPFPYNSHSHHAISIDQMKNNSVTQMKINTLYLKVNENESVAETLANNLVEPLNTVLIVPGKDGTLALSTVRDVIPLLLAIIGQDSTPSEAI